MKRIITTAAFVISTIGFLSCEERTNYKIEESGSWCPKGASISGATTITVEGIVDYEDMNWCKVVLNSDGFKSEIYFTQDGLRQRWIQYKNGMLRSDMEVRKAKAVMRLYDEKGNLVEEVKSKEAF
ncbi:MAG: hypothetical protein ACK4SM_04025 [Aquificaceae bacterium]